MPSQLLKEALNGNEVALLQAAFLISSGEMLASDINFLKKKLDFLDKANKFEKYIIARLYFFGAPNFEKDEVKAERLITGLIDDTNFSYAKTMLAGIKKNDEMMTALAIKEFNPIAVLQYLKINFMDEPLDLDKLTIANTFQKIKEGLRCLSIVAPVLEKTSLREAIREFCYNLLEQLTESSEKLAESKEKSHSLTMFEEKNTSSYMAKILLEFAKFFENTNRRMSMCYTLKLASTINPKHEKQWLIALGADKFNYNDIKDFINFYLMAEKIIEKKLATNTLSDDELGRLYFSRSIELKNCELIFNHYKSGLNLQQGRELSTLLDQCRTYHKTLESMVVRKEIISVEEIANKFRV